MMFSEQFICATTEYNTFENPVPAPYFRKTVTSNGTSPIRICVACCGFYELFWNGRRITRGFLSPYISNPDHYVYGDQYEVLPEEGENVIGVWLGNGFQNNPAGYIWDFDKAPFRSSPRFSLLATQNGQVLAESDESFRTAPSPIRTDDYRFGEVYDATLEWAGWNQRGFDDASWSSALLAPRPKGEIRVADVAPIVKEAELKPCSITPCGEGYLYDFGISTAGICRLQIRGAKGQRIEIRHADSLQDGDLNLAQIWFSSSRYQWERDRHIVHRDVYVCKGDGLETYTPTFTYHGFRYVRVDGITPEQATEALLTALVYHTDLQTLGDFSCSDAVVNTLQAITRRSILTNFHHYPTDCPQREKNGWTADAALSCEAALLNFNPERNYRVWMRSIRKAQAENGSLPGIVPTGGWGFDWGNGPAWDCVLVWLPYYTYLLRGETDMIYESAEAFLAYLRYLRTRVDEKGLLAIGLGDWCPVGGGEPKAPLIVTDSVTAMDIANKMAVLFDAISRPADAAYARGEAEAYRTAIRTHLIEPSSLLVAGECQTCQAMCLAHGVFSEEERPEAFARLLEMVHACGDHMDVGVLGGRVLFRVLSDFGYADLAYHMITREDFPSYGNWLKRGATTLWENFYPNYVASMNHHFWGDISAWFMEYLGGIRPNPGLHDPSKVEIRPCFVSQLSHANAFCTVLGGRLETHWQRTDDGILLTVQVPEGVRATGTLPDGYRFADGAVSKALSSGVYEISAQ